MALLDTFNDIQIKRSLSDGTEDFFKVPLTFGSRDKAYVLSEQDSEALKRGNINIFPRMVLAFDDMAPNRERQTSKYTKFNKVIDGEKISFQYNSVPMDFTFTLHIATRSFSDMMMIQEQIIPFFNPTYQLHVNEMEIGNIEPTNVPVLFNDSSVTIPEDLEEADIRLIEGTISVSIRGNLFPPIKEAALVKKVKVYAGQIIDGSNLRSSKYEFGIEDGQVTSASDKIEFYQTIGANNPIISSVLGNFTVNAGDKRDYTVRFADIDSEDFIYVWSIVSGSGIIGTNSKTVTYSSDLSLSISEDVVIRVIVIDEKGLQSEPQDFTVRVEV